MLVLGLNGNFSTRDADLVPDMLEFFFHDASASLVRDGELIAAVEEERYNRIKKTTRFPVNAIQACLTEAGVTPADVDAVGFYFREDHMDMVLNQLYTEHPAVPLRYSRELIRHRLRVEFDWDLPDDRLLYVPHHLAHAMSSYVHSGMANALVVIMDARGEEHSGTVFVAEDGRLDTVATYPVHQSLGTWYLNATQLFGYKFGDEYKVMGLAPYGDPDRYRELFESLYSLQDKGRYELVPNVIAPNAFGPALFRDGFRPRRKGEPFSRDHKDFAAALQDNVQRIVLHVLSHWAQTTGLRSLCFGGGVAHNSSLNGEILRSGLFDEVFVHPSSHDAGAGAGAAVAAGHVLAGGSLPRARLRGAGLGGGLGDDGRIAASLAEWDDLVEVVHRGEDTIDVAARLLADGAVLGWARGRSEFGPRALGHRSILADPRPKENQTRINAMVKKRESFRPFAPVVTPEAAPVYFDMTGTAANHDFMSFVLRVHPQHRELLGAVTHVDGTARVQVVDPAVNEPFHRLVTRFGELTGTPVLLNTSFNNHAEPIVQTFQDVMTGFLTTDLDYLVIGDHVVRRRQVPSALDRLVPVFRPETRLTGSVAFRYSGERVETHQISLDYSTGSRTGVSAELHALLARTDGMRCLAELAGCPLPGELREEVRALWGERYFTLRPA